MTLIQLRNDDPKSLQCPVNKDLIITFHKAQGESVYDGGNPYEDWYRWAIKFTFVSGQVILWEYLEEEMRDRDYEYLKKTIVGVPDL